MIKKVNSELEIIYEYYKHEKEDIWNNPQREYTRDELGNRQTISESLYYFLQDYYAESNHPQILSDEEYLRLSAKELYHGFVNLRHAASYLWDIRKHYGGGIFGSGFYLSDNIDDAIGYTEVGFTVDRDKIVRMKVDLDSLRIIDHHEIRKVANVAKAGYDLRYLLNLSRLKSNERKKLMELSKFFKAAGDDDFVKDFTFDESNMAIYLGFDAVRHESGHDLNYAILKPDKLMVSESEFERVMVAAGGKYKEQIEFWRENGDEKSM